MKPYHRGELVVQERAGLTKMAEAVSGAIMTEIPDLAADFIEEQPMLVIGAADSRGEVWSSLLAGEPGFITVTGPSTLSVAAALSPGDPLYRTLAEPTRLGMIAIEPDTRRRMRMNGTARPTRDGLEITLEQIYANCPKYIQKRVPQWHPTTPDDPREAGALAEEDIALVDSTDTFFIATTDLDGNADASHRGGNPGFLQVRGPRLLRWPDYVGNSMFNTFGNLEVNPRAGLMIPDWTTGTLLHLTGTAAVDWDPDHAAALPGAQRVVDFTVERLVRVNNASPLRWTAPQFSRFNPPIAHEGAST
ncbi:pyridoxamine 5'-phosphate oxidase family protein [Streptomyces tendae]|uniref:Pyridoxamine 5'-phosphate oxidase family protein n=1 Tax=Streptomyces tendae TaxID=1932 RepID=A0ABX6A0Y2_STRTE|nr:pyridoxamine 5'-phosphate oxidase family protein [Streptomyces tendae]QER90514.1 pyridoxamine 5'-phosphate oxidase family protein [Streptomyces tendae]